MRTNKLLTITTLLTLMLILTVTYSANAENQAIDWMGEEYGVESQTEVHAGTGGGPVDDSDSSSVYSNSNLPIAASASNASGDQTSNATSNISSTGVGNISMSTTAYVESVDLGGAIFVPSASASASALFEGTFDAPWIANEPLVFAGAEPIFIDNVNLIIDYDISYHMNVIGYDDYATAWHDTQVSIEISGFGLDPIYINPLDGLDSSYFEVYGMDSDSNTGSDSRRYSIALTPGFSYDVAVYLDEDVYADFSADAGALSTNLDMDMYLDVVVVPEPVSSALFVVGAATLVFSGYRRKKRVS